MKMSKSTEYVVNLHLTKYCNYKCVFCHSRFERADCLSVDSWKKVVDNICADIKVKRFNFAGGEPLLYPNLIELIDYVHNKGIDASIISNGSLITDEFLREIKGKCTMIGLSIDSLEESESIRLGRCTNKKVALTMPELLSLCSKIREEGFELKVNTVITNTNYTQDFTEFIKTIKPSRWKVFKVLCIENENAIAKQWVPSIEQFKYFVDKHLELNPVIEADGDLINAYIVVNPNGKLLDNSGLSYVEYDVLNVPFIEQFRKIMFNDESYKKRYKQT